MWDPSVPQLAVAGGMPDEELSAKFKQVQGLCLLKRNDAPEAMKEDGRKENCPGKTVWGHPMLSTDSPPKENEGKSSTSSSGRPRAREVAAISTHSSPRPGVGLTPAPKPQGDPSIVFQPPGDNGNDPKARIIRNTFSKWWKDINKLDIFPSMRQFGTCS